MRVCGEDGVCGAEIFGVDVGENGVDLRGSGGEGAIRRLLDLGVDVALKLGDGGFVEDAFSEEMLLETSDGVAKNVGFDLSRGAISALVIGEGVRVGTDDVAVDKGRAAAIAAVLHGISHGLVAGDEVGAVDFGEVEVWEVRDEPGDVAAGGVRFDRGGDGVLVVFNEEDDGEFAVGGGVEGLPELALRGGAFADGDVDDFVIVEGDVFEFAVVAGLLRGGFRMA